MCGLSAGGFGGTDKGRSKSNRPGFKVNQHKTAIERAYVAGTSTGGEGKALSAGYMSRLGLERRCGSLHGSLGAGKMKVDLPRTYPISLSGRGPDCQM